MRILISDHSGHPFQVQLSRELARRGHDVLHVSSASFQTPKGRLEAREGDPSSFRSVTVANKGGFNKSGLLSRFFQERESGILIANVIADFHPDVVISSNAPIGTQKELMKATSRENAKFVFWVQDLYGEAMRTILGSRLGWPGSLIGRYYERLEHRMLAKSDHIVAIADDFSKYLERFGHAAKKITTIENWAPIDEITEFDRDNAWAAERLPPAKSRAIYSGTLGKKHDPDLLIELARRFDGDVVVFSEGDAADYVRRVAREENLSNIRVQGWVAFDDLSNALAAADILLVVLEPEAGAFSVPSKVLTYLCVGRPIVGSIRSENLAAKTIAAANAGVTVEPHERERFIEAVCGLAKDENLRNSMGRSARQYAEHAFDIARIGDRFEQICLTLSGDIDD